MFGGDEGELKLSLALPENRSQDSDSLHVRLPFRLGQNEEWRWMVAVWCWWMNDMFSPFQAQSRKFTKAAD